MKTSVFAALVVANLYSTSVVAAEFVTPNAYSETRMSQDEVNLILYGKSNHFQHCRNTNHCPPGDYNENNWGIGIQYDHVINGRWNLTTTVGRYIDSYGKWSEVFMVAGPRYKWFSGSLYAGADIGYVTGSRIDGFVMYPVFGYNAKYGSVEGTVTPYVVAMWLKIKIGEVR